MADMAASSPISALSFSTAAQLDTKMAGWLQACIAQRQGCIHRVRSGIPADRAALLPEGMALQSMENK